MASTTLDALRDAVEGLVYISETDAPWEAFAWPEAAGSPTAEEVRRLGGHPPDAPAEESDWFEFIEPKTTDEDWHGDAERADVRRYRRLREVVERRMTDVRIVRIGEIEVTTYVVGRAVEGGWAGVRARAVET
jgi:hypothetical protein